MLNAVKYGKKRGTGLVATNLQEAEGAEDVLTATVFERLAYLPDALLTRILSVLFDHLLPLGALLKCEFWPSWRLNGQRVEPDLLLQWEHSRFLVEAKRWDGVQQQSASQLARELAAGIVGGFLQDGDHLLVLGGMADAHSAAHQQLQQGIRARLAELGQENCQVAVHCCSWRQLFLVIENVLLNDGSPHWQRMLDDMRDAYHWHGLQTRPRQWLHEMLSPSRLKREALPRFGIALARESTSLTQTGSVACGFGSLRRQHYTICCQRVPLGIHPAAH